MSEIAHRSLTVLSLATLMLLFALLALVGVASIALDALPDGTVAEFLHDSRHILGVPGH